MKGSVSVVLFKGDRGFLAEGRTACKLCRSASGRCLITERRRREAVSAQLFDYRLHLARRNALHMHLCRCRHQRPFAEPLRRYAPARPHGAQIAVLQPPSPIQLQAANGRKPDLPLSLTKARHRRRLFAGSRRTASILGVTRGMKNEGRVRLFSSVYRQYLTIHEPG